MDKRKRARTSGWLSARRVVRVVAMLAAAGAFAIVAGAAYGQLEPLNDLFALGQGGGESPAAAPVARRAEPPFVATPLVPCGPGSRPQPGVDGRVPAGSAKDGLSCNVALIGHQGTEGGFKVYRYIDARGHECAFYDTTLMFPLNALNPGGGSEGVAVLDMSDPSHPVQTDTLTTTPMLSPHESLNLNSQRGLLAAVNGNLSTEPGFVSIYDVQADCRHPVLQSITAIDVTNPKTPHAVWQGNVFSHGMTLSENGNRAYIADPKDRGMLILDTSQIQARKPNPQTREISRLTWKSVSIPQNAIPFTEQGHPYVLEFDEYDQSTLDPNGDPHIVGAARIIDISDETKPYVVSNLRLQVDQPADHAAAANDPGGNGAPQGYAAHYCNIPTRVDPKVVACSFIASGLRIFDISDLVHPKEIGYFVAPPQPRSENGNRASDFAMSKPAFAPERREVWFSDGTSGFYVLRVDKSVWPQDTTPASNRAPRCQSRRRLLVKARIPRAAGVRSVRATLRGKRVGTVRRRGGVYAVADLRRVPRGTARLVIRVRLANGRTVTTRRTYRLCTRPLPRSHRRPVRR